MKPYQAHRFAIAPMMEWTDRHCRFFHRLLTRRALIYTEMITTGAVLHGARARLMAHDPAEHPVALQLGGCDPRQLAECARIAEAFGYDEVNLNVGCPSDRVQVGRFGACLMAEPALVGDCVAAMTSVVKLPVTVKCRIGIDDQDPEEALEALTCAVEQAGVAALIVHARKAWLDGLSPRENRDIPPLDYARVYRLKAAPWSCNRAQWRHRGHRSSAGAPAAPRWRDDGTRRLSGPVASVGHRSRAVRRACALCIAQGGGRGPHPVYRARACPRHAAQRHDAARAGPIPWRSRRTRLSPAPRGRGSKTGRGRCCIPRSARSGRG